LAVKRYGEHAHAGLVEAIRAVRVIAVINLNIFVEAIWLGERWNRPPLVGGDQQIVTWERPLATTSGSIV